MLIWTRLGFLVFVFVFGSSLAANLITNEVAGNEAYWDANRWPVGVALAVAGLLSWVVGAALARRQVPGRAPHAAFFIPMTWWGPLLILGGAALAIHDRLR